MAYNTTEEIKRLEQERGILKTALEEILLEAECTDGSYLIALKALEDCDGV